MKITFASYEHSRIGFPGIKLKWHAKNGKFLDPYVTINGVIQENRWTWGNPHPAAFAQAEMERFDEWVGNLFSNDASVQG
jgi:hypothetical protein